MTVQNDAYSGWPAPGTKPAPKAPTPPPLMADDPRLREVAKALEQARERAELDQATIQKLLAEIRDLKGHPGIAAPLDTGGAGGMPAAPGALEATPIADIMDAAAGEPGEDEAKRELDALRKQAQSLGIPVDLRWGYKRLAREIAQAEGKQ
jgi:nucleotide-binding universal stress UspA family protein